ncbi:hypothetical protein [Clostridium perfringens]|uniref:hypothetical protein n=1 Tax=Clostridium perfringens TaxID=1502 RepID=UPI001C85887F|nr:hypothetical protein [Clostridium perfringens]
MINKLFLDLNNFKPNLGSVERGDSIELNIKLLNDEDYSRSKFRLLGAKSDGKSVEQIEGLNLEEKDLKVVLEDQFVNCEGIVKLELNVVSGETEITTKEFYFFVSNTMNAEIIDSADSIPTLEKVSKYVDDAVNNLDALKEASEDITIINSEFKENEIKRKANEMLREKNEKARLQSEDIRITEEEEREANELERIKAENNRKVSESNRKVSENTRVTNERAREEAELSRQSTFEENEEIRNSNENLRIASEKERIKFNNKAKTDEVNRKEAETKRVEAEKTRVIAEDERKKAETSRQEAEDIRQNTYTNFNEAEEERRNNEISRQEAEALRIEAEKRRDDLYSQKEEERNAAFLESERTRGTAFNEAQNDRNLTFEESERVREEAFKVSEAARNEAEEGRVAAELLRVEAEKLRVAGEENRNTTFTQSEEERQGVFEEAENARKVAESKRVAAETGRGEAEKLRVTAETERVEAENLRATAEEERVAAETKRKESFNKFEGKINANTEELKNARSATTGEVFDTLDERIDHEVDRLNKKIDVTMLQQEDKENHVIENTVEGMTTDMVVKGRTLQNIIKMSDFSLREIGSLEGTTFKINRSSSSQVTAISLAKKFLPFIKSNTVYTVMAVIENNTLSGEFALIHSYQNTMFTKNPVMIPSGFNGFVSKKFTTIDDITLGDRMEINFQLVTGTVDIKNLIILEGDYTNTFFDTYFEGIKSFGEAEGNKISILSHNKNLFDGIFETGKVIDGSGNLVNASSDKLDSKTTKNFIKVIPTKKYILQGLATPSYDTIALYDINRNFVKRVWENPVTIPINCYYIKVVFKNKLQIEEGTQPSPYEPYQSDKKDILLQDLGFDEGFRGLNKTAYDELNSIMDVAVKRVEKKVLNGDNEGWGVWTNSTGDVINAYVYFNDVIPSLKGRVKPDSICLNDRLPSNQGGHLSTTEGFKITSTYFTLSIHKSKLGVENVNDPNNTTALKNWLKQNPITVYYELAEPVETPLIDPVNVKTFNEKTYVSFENAISGTSSFKTPVDTTATIARLNRENRTLEEENRSLRQDFESTTLSLTDSDLELVKQNVDMDFRLMEVEFALDIPQAILSSDIKFKNKKGEVKSMARTPYEMMKIVILSGDYDREDYMHKVGKYYERRRMTKEEHDELMSLMTADEVISK